MSAAYDAEYWAKESLRAFQKKCGVVPGDSATPAAHPARARIKFITSCHEMSERRQDFDCVGDLSKLRAKVEADAKESGCDHYIVLRDGDQYAVWRDE